LKKGELFPRLDRKRRQKKKNGGETMKMHQRAGEKAAFWFHQAGRT